MCAWRTLLSFFSFAEIGVRVLQAYLLLGASSKSQVLSTKKVG